MGTWLKKVVGDRLDRDEITEGGTFLPEKEEESLGSRMRPRYGILST